MKASNLSIAVFSIIVLFSVQLKAQEQNSATGIFSNETIGIYFVDDMAKVNIGGKYGFIDRQGFVQIPCEYDMVQNFDNGLAIVRQKDK